MKTLDPAPWSRLSPERWFNSVIAKSELAKDDAIYISVITRSVFCDEVIHKNLDRHAVLLTARQLAMTK